MKKSTKLIIKSLIFAGTLAFTTFVGAEGSEAASDKTKKEEKSTVEVQVNTGNEVKKGNSQAHLHASAKAKKNASPNSAVHRTVSTTAVEVAPVTEELENKKTDQTVVTEEPVIEKESVKVIPSVQNKAKAMASERASLRAKEKAAPNSAVHAVLPTTEEKPEKEEATEEVTEEATVEKEKNEEDATEENAEKEATDVEAKKDAQIEIVITVSPSIFDQAKAMASQLASLIAKKQEAINLAVHADSSTSPLTNEIVVKIFVEEELAEKM